MEIQLTDDRKHTLGRVLLVGGLAAAALAVLGFLPSSPYFGAVLAGLSLALCFYGIYLKKKYCPLCRKGPCDLKDPL